MIRTIWTRLAAPDDRGFALIVVLWIAGLVSVMVASLAVSSRTQLRVTENVTESAKAEALADAGAQLAVLDLLAALRVRQHRRRFPIDGQPVTCSVPGEGVLTISVADEALRVDINTAGVPIMQALIAGLGEAPERAASIAEAIFDFRDRDTRKMPNGAEAAEYEAAGLAWLPKNGPFQSPEELGQVYGMTPDLLEKLRPHMGVHSGLPGIDAAHADGRLIDLLQNGVGSGAGTFGSFPEIHSTVTLPAIFVSSSQHNVYSVHIAAHTPAGAVFVRKAVIHLGSPLAPRHRFLQWTRGEGGHPISGDQTASAC